VAVVVIPKFLHQVWVGPPVPEQFAEWAAEWKRMHPSWVYLLWLDADLASFTMTNQRLYDDAEQIAGPSANQFRADLARYEILYRYGGVYVDLDCEPLRPLDPLLDAEAFVGWETDLVWANNAVMGAEPFHPWLADLIDGLPAHVAAHPGRRPNVLSGPQYITPRLTLDITVHPSRAFYPYLWSDVGTARESGPFPDAYCVHHWNNTRQRNRGRTIRRSQQPPQAVRRRGAGHEGVAEQSDPGQVP